MTLEKTVFIIWLSMVVMTPEMTAEVNIRLTKLKAITTMIKPSAHLLPLNIDLNARKSASFKVPRIVFIKNFRSK